MPPNNQEFQQKEEAAQEQSSYVQEGLFSYVRMDQLLKTVRLLSLWNTSLWKKGIIKEPSSFS